MTDLPCLRFPLPPIQQPDEEWSLWCMRDWGTRHLATAEEVTKILELAGYRVIDPATVANFRDLLPTSKDYDKEIIDRLTRVAELLHKVLGAP